MRLVPWHVSATLICLITLDASHVRGETETFAGAPVEGDSGAAESQSETEEAAPESTSTESQQVTINPRNAPLSVFGFSGPQPGRITVSLGGGWPSGWLEVDYGANERLGVGLQVGYLYAVPTGGFQMASGVQITLPTRLTLLRRPTLEFVLDIAAGIVVSLDHRLSLITFDPEDPEATGLVPQDQLRPIGTQLSVGATVSWLLNQSIVLKFGLQIPATLVIDMTERPYDDTWELAVPFAARVGIVWRALRWLGLFAVVDVGPSLVVTPSEWSSDGYERDVGVDVFLRASAGITFAPWP